MMPLFKSSSLINRFFLQSTVNQFATLTSVKIKLDGKPINIQDLPKKPKSLNLFQKYCSELGITEDELKSQRAQLLKAWNENKQSFIDKNRSIVDEHKNELKAYRDVWKKPIKLEDIQDLIKFCNKKIAKENARKSRKLSFYAFFIKQAANDGLGKNLADLSQKYKNLSSSELERYKNLYDNYLKSLN